MDDTFYIIAIIIGFLLIMNLIQSAEINKLKKEKDKLYKEISNPALGTLDSLKDLLHQFELNKQYYVSFYLSFVPFFVCEMIIILESMPQTHHYSDTMLTIVFLGSVAFGLTMVYFIGMAWFKNFYGKYIDRIKKLVDEMKK